MRPTGTRPDSPLRFASGLKPSRATRSSAFGLAISALLRSVAAALACAALLPQARPAEGPGTSALSLLDAYLAHASRTDPRYRADLRPGGDPRSPAPGRMSATGPVLGAFTFRPKTYAELTAREREEVLRDPRFRAFIEASGPACPPKLRAAERRRISIAPEDMLSPAPLYLRLPPP